MPKRTQNDSAPFQTIPNATRLTGLSQRYLRDGCKSGLVPHVRVGTVFLVNVPALLKSLEAATDGKEKLW